MFWKKKIKISEHNIFIPPNKKVLYPKWTFVYCQDTDEYFLIWNKPYKKKFISERAFLSWSHDPIIASKESLSGYALNGRLGFRSGTLLQQIGTTQQFLVTDSVVRAIKTPDLYDVLGYNYYDAIIISESELEFHTKGDDIIGIDF